MASTRYHGHAQDPQQGRQISAAAVVAAASSFTTVLRTGPAFTSYTTLPVGSDANIHLAIFDNDKTGDDVPGLVHILDLGHDPFPLYDPGFFSGDLDDDDEPPELGTSYVHPA